MIKLMCADEHHVWNLTLDDESKTTVESAIAGQKTGPIKLKNHGMGGHAVILAEHVRMYVYVPEEEYRELQRKEKEKREGRGRGGLVRAGLADPKQEKRLRGEK